MQKRVDVISVSYGQTPPRDMTQIIVDIVLRQISLDDHRLDPTAEERNAQLTSELDDFNARGSQSKDNGASR